MTANLNVNSRVFNQYVVEFFEFKKRFALKRILIKVEQNTAN